VGANHFGGDAALAGQVPGAELKAIESMRDFAARILLFTTKSQRSQRNLGEDESFLNEFMIF
jgi:hypothetical protein